jgi:uncharacterized protein YlxP (DUF503 family)
VTEVVVLPASLKEKKMINKDIIDRIKKCLALGDSSRNTNENEVAVALAMAKTLMAKHNLSMAEIAETDEKLTEEIIQHRMQERSGAPNWEYDLALVCCYLFSVRSFVNIGYPRYKRTVCFVGYELDVAVSVEVYKLLKMEVGTMGLNWSRDDFDSQTLSVKAALVRRHKYIDGIVQTLIKRAHDKVEGLSNVQLAKTNALVITKTSAIDKYLKDELDLRDSRRKATDAHRDAYWSGKQDGKNISMDFDKAVKGNSAEPLKLEHK